MKRIYYFLTIAVMVLAPLAMTSCDNPYYDDWWYDDPDEWYDRPYDDGSDDLVAMAQMLNGSWTGELTNEYTGEDGNRYQTNMYVDFSFIQYTANSNNGNGFETDYVPKTDKYGKPLRDDDGNVLYDSQTLQFKWYIDPRTYNIYVEYASGMRYVLDSRGNSQTSGFSLSNNDFSGVMEGVNNDEFIFFSLNRVSGYNAPLKTKAIDGAAKTVRFGKGERKQISDSDVPVMLRRR